MRMELTAGWKLVRNGDLSNVSAQATSARQLIRVVRCAENEAEE
jgi:hypothetical protein